MPRRSVPTRRLAPTGVLAVALVVLTGCAGGPEAFDAGTPDGPFVEDVDIRTVQLHAESDEASLPILTLGESDRLRLAFDWLVADGGRPLEVSFVHTDRTGREDLLPTEYLTGFERDDLTDYRRSGVSTIPYVHYEYRFPNARIGFELSGNYRLQVRDGGRLLFERPFFVAERLAEVSLGFGTTLAGGQAGVSVQPAARVRPGPALAGFDAFQYTVCFARDGRLTALRCAPEPSAVDLAFYQYFLRREAAFEPAEPLFEFDLGLLALNAQVVEANPAAVPPTATLDLDYAEFGGDVVQPGLAATPLIDAAYRDVGDARTDADYVDIRFRYVPPNQRASARPLYVLGSFNAWTPAPVYRMAWDPAERRYETTIRLKQGRYVYGYASPGGPVRAGIAVGQSSVYTAFVYFRDPRRFTDRLVAVESAVAF